MICSVFTTFSSMTQHHHHQGLTTTLILVLTTLAYLTECKPTTSNDNNNDIVNTTHTTIIWTNEPTQSTTQAPSTTIDTLSDFPDSVIDYLVKYGYLDELRAYKLQKKPYNTMDKTAYTRLGLEAGVREYQDFMNLPTTGRLDKQTTSMLHKKRCGMPDKVRRDSTKLKMSLTPTGQRKRRDLVLQKVDKNKKGSGFASSKTTKKFYWNINPKPKFGTLLRPNIWYSLEYAFNRWASVTDIVFIRGDSLNWSDIMIGFWSKDHGDGNPFDGPGGTIGHANVANRNVHLDEEENWNAKPQDIFLWLHPSKGTDFVQAAIHEIGHVLNLSHDKAADSVMYPTLQAFQPMSVYSLSENDMRRVKASFGRCEPDVIDGIFTNKYLDGKTYIFKGPFIYQIDDNKRRVAQSWPRATTLDFYSPTFIDEAFWHTDFFLYFFDKDKYYIFDSTNDPKVHRSQPINLNVNGYDVGFRGLKHHNYIDAAMVMKYQGKDTSFIFQDEWVYKWDLLGASWQRSILPAEKAAAGWPKKIKDVFPGLPGRINTAFTWSYDGRTYFFAGRYFYIWDPIKGIADGLYPTYQWQNVCDVYLCQVAPKPNVYNCESWDLTKDNCYGYCT